MLMAGKMSVCIVTIDTIPMTAISSATTTNVYGRRSASRTIHMGGVPPGYLPGTRKLPSSDKARRGPLREIKVPRCEADGSECKERDSAGEWGGKFSGTGQGSCPGERKLTQRRSGNP